MKNPQSNLPPGFRFHPTDEELILHYLKKKVSSAAFPGSIIADVDIYKFNPWDLPDKAAFGEKEWYFFSPRDRKYPNGARPNRAAGSGYWKATGTDKIIMAHQTSLVSHNSLQQHKLQETIGVKKALVFYKGRPPKGVKTNWIMHEYRLSDSLTCRASNNKPVKPKDSSMRLDDFVLCRIYKKSNTLHPAMAAATVSGDQDQEEEEEQIFVQETKFATMKGQISPVISNKQPLMSQKSCSFSNLLDAMDYSLLSSFLADNNNMTSAPLNNSSGYNDYSTFNGAILDQPNLFNTYNGNGNGNGGGGSNLGPGNSQLVQKLPNQFHAASNIPCNEAKFLKRQYSNVEEDLVQYPSKKYINSCSFIGTNTSSQNEYYSLLSPLPFLNQHTYF